MQEGLTLANISLLAEMVVAKGGLDQLTTEDKLWLQTSGKCAVCGKTLNYFEITKLELSEVMLVDTKSEIFVFHVKLCLNCFESVSVQESYGVIDEIMDFYER